MNLNPKWIAVGAGALVLVGTVLAFVLLGGGDEPDPEPTEGSGGPSVTITPPVADPTEGADDGHDHGDIPHDEDDHAPEGLESAWTFAEGADEHDAHDHGDEEIDTTTWVPAAQGFVTAFQNVGVDDATWLAGITPYVDERLHDAYATPGVRENVYVSEFRDFELVMGGETATRVRATFADSGANMILDLGLGDTASGWIVTRVSPDTE